MPFEELKQRHAAVWGAAECGLDIDYRVGDAEALDLEDRSFDLVASTCGVMFTPDHSAVARELAQVTKPGGRIGSRTYLLTLGTRK